MGARLEGRRTRERPRKTCMNERERGESKTNWDESTGVSKITIMKYEGKFYKVQSVA